MINTMTPPVLWPLLQRKLRRLHAKGADWRCRKAARLEFERLGDRTMRDIGLYERPAQRLRRSPRRGL